MKGTQKREKYRLSEKFFRKWFSRPPINAKQGQTEALIRQRATRLELQLLECEAAARQAFPSRKKPTETAAGR